MNETTTVRRKRQADDNSDFLDMVNQVVNQFIENLDVGEAEVLETEVSEIDLVWLDPNVENIDCADGNNGGCSHFCNQADHVCECPSCWTLLEDEATCTPNPEKISISCDQSAMSLSLDKCIYSTDESDEIVLSFDDNRCESAESEDQFVISTALDQCDTLTTVEDDEIVFKNVISVKKRTNKYGIILNTDVDIDVQERFPKFRVKIIC